MSEAMNQVTAAFDALTTALRQAAMTGPATEFKRVAEYVEETGKLQQNWASELPASGVVKAKPGRKPKSATVATDNLEGVTGEVSEDGTVTPPPSNRGRPRNNA